MVPVAEKVYPPAELMADCEGAAEPDIGAALANRRSIILCERDKNARLRAWAER